MNMQYQIWISEFVYSEVHPVPTARRPL